MQRASMMEQIDKVARGALRGAALAVAASVLSLSPAAADGEFLQFDFAPDASSLTATMRRDRLTFSLGWSEFSTGQAASLWASYGIPVGEGWLRIGPSLRVDNAGETDIGIRAGLEHFSMAGRRTFFLLAEANSIQGEYQALAQIGDQPTGLAAEVSFQGNRTGFRERTLAVSYRLGDGPARLRAGYRFNSGQAFIGFSINTF
ncbi:MAG: hypothetical protein ACK4GT_06990 [Pararhodobacter sp.]